MNTYTQYLSDTVVEVRAFAATAEGRKREVEWYAQIVSLVEKVCAQTTDEAAERYLDMLMWTVVDPGPFQKGFLPSIDRAAEAMQRKRQQEFKARRLAE